MLLDIYEPGQTPLPHSGERNVAIGIDLGTTHSLVAVAHDEQVEVLRDLQGVALVPSAVDYSSTTPLVGQHARAEASRGNPRAVTSIKRLMGRSRADVQSDHHYPFSASEGPIRLALGGKELTPMEISADILRHLKRHAESALGHEVLDAVITVPAYFDEAARLATKDAARLAGLNVLRLLNEPTAAALAYGLDRKAEGIYAVYDLGGGTFDISILRLEKGVFQVLATGGDTQLGGDDFDAAIVRSVTGNDMSTPDRATLLAAARHAREALSSSENAELDPTLGSKRISVALTRESFERLADPIIHRTLEACQRTMEDAELVAKDISAVILVGGMTRTPLVRKKVAAFFGVPILSDINPDEIVAAGAAIQARALSHGGNHLLLDVTPLSLGLETMGGMVEKIIHRNSPIPVTAMQEFTTYKDGQTGMVVHVLQGEREMVDQNRSLAHFELKGIPPLPAGIARVKITFTIDADGLLTVEATEETTGIRQSVDVKPAYGLEIEEIERMIRDSMAHAREDITLRLLAESRTEAERTIIETESAMAADSHLLRPGEKEVVESQIRRLHQAIPGPDRDTIDYEAGELARVTRSFAERRMNTAIAKAIGGKHVDHWSEET